MRTINIGVLIAIYFINLKISSNIISTIPVSEIINMVSAIFSKRCSLILFSVRIEIKEKKQEQVNNSAMMEVNSSIKLDAEVPVICTDVITKRQKPKRFAAVLKICWEVLFAIV